jgi:hypothetical protein
MKLRDYLHIDIIHKCIEARSILNLNIKDPCGWTHMACFIIKVHLINVKQWSFKSIIAIPHMEKLTFQVWKGWFCVQKCFKCVIHISPYKAPRHLFMKCGIFNFTMNVLKINIKNLKT